MRLQPSAVVRLDDRGGLRACAMLRGVVAMILTASAQEQRREHADAGVHAVEQRGLHDARQPVVLPDVPAPHAARLPRLQGPRPVDVLRRACAIRISSAARSGRSPRERSWIERLADWKARQRRDDPRRSSATRSATSIAPSGARDAIAQEVAQRVALNQTSFAQVPLLNPDQLVTSWREMLPDLRDPEYRRVPLDVKEPGVYLVEAVSGLLRAYTIVDRLGRRAGHQGRARADAGVRRRSRSAASRSRLRRAGARRSEGGRQRQDRRRRRPHRRAARRQRPTTSSASRAAATQVAVTDPAAGLPASRRASWSATSTPTNRSIGPGTPCTSRPCCAGASATRCCRSIGRPPRSASATSTTRWSSGRR